MPSLKFIIEGDDTPLRKKLAELRNIASKNGGQAIADAQQAVAAVKVETDQRMANIKAINDETQAIKKQNLELLAKPKKVTEVSSSQAEADAYNNSRTPNGGYTPPFQPISIEDLNQQVAAVQVAKAKIDAMYESGAIGAEKHATSIQALIAKENELKAAIDSRSVAVEEEVAASNKASSAVENEIGLLENLKATIKQLNANKLKIVDEAQLNKQNALIQEAEAEMGRLNNRGKVGYDELGNKIEQTVEKQSKFSAAISKATNLSNIGATVVSRLSRQIIGLGVGMLSFAVGSKAIEGLITWIANLDVFSGRLDQAKHNLEAFSEVNANAAKTAAESVSSLKILYAAATDVNASMKDRIAAAQKLKAEYPDAFANAKLQAILNGQERDSYNDLTRSIIDNAKATAAKAKLDEIEGKKLDIEFQKQQLRDRTRKALAQAQFLPTTTRGTNSDAITNPRQDAIDRINEGDATQLERLNQDEKILQGTADFLIKYAGGNQKIAKLLDANNKLIQEPLKNFDAIVKNASDKADLDNLKASLEAKMKALAPNDAQIEIYRNKIRIVEELQKKYDAKLKTSDPAQQSGQSLTAEITRQLNDIDKLRDKYSAKNKTRDDQEADAIKADFKAQREQIDALNVKYDQYLRKFGQKGIDKYNSDPANKVKLRRIDPTQLDPIEQKALEDLKAKQSIDATKNTVEEQKQLFEEYERYKLQFGTEQADKMFSSQLKGYTTFVAYLRSLIPKPDDRSSAANTMRDYLKDAIPAAIRDQDKEAYNLVLSNLSRVLDATKTSASERLKIEDQYQKDVLTIALNYSGKDAEARILKRKQQRDRAIEDTKTLAFEETKIYNDAVTNNLNLTLSMLKAKVDLLKSELKIDASKALGDPTKLTPAQRKQIEDMYKGAKELLNTGTPTAKLFGDIEKYSGMASNSFGQISHSLEGINPGLAQAFDGMSKFASFASNAASAVLSFASGDIAGGISGTIGLIASVFSLFDHSKEAAEQNKLTADLQIKATEAVTKALERQLDVAKQLYGPERVTAYIRSLGDLKKTQDELMGKVAGKLQLTDNATLNNWIKQYNDGVLDGFFSKIVEDGINAGAIFNLAGKSLEDLQKLLDAGKLDDSTAAIVNNLVTIKQQIIDTQNAIHAELTGEDFSSLEDSIVNIFKQGKTAVADFADNFKETMQNAIVESFKRQFLEKQLQTFYDDFANAFTNGAPDAAALKKLQDEYNDIIAKAAAAFKDLQGVTGITFDNTGSNNVSSAIKGITADQADLLAGQFGGMRLAQLQTNILLSTGNASLAQQTAISMQGIVYLQKIEANTLRTANNTDVLTNMDKTLTSIDKNTKSASGTLGANGKIP